MNYNLKTFLKSSKPFVLFVSNKSLKLQTDKKWALNSQLQTYQILTNDDQMLNLYLSYFIATVYIMRVLSKLGSTCYLWGEGTVLLSY